MHLVDLHAELPYYPRKDRLGEALCRGLPLSCDMTITRHGTRYRIDPSEECHRALLTAGVYEAPSGFFVREYLKPGMVAADVGANFGYYSLLCSRRVGPAGKVYAFEPTPITFEFLTENIRQNPYACNVQARQCAVGDRCGRVRVMQKFGAGPSGRNFVATGGGDVELITIDSLGLPRLDLIKTDVEGFDLRVLRGAEATIRRCRPALLAEVNIQELQRNGDSHTAMLAFLEGLGYRLRVPTWRGRLPLHKFRKRTQFNVVGYPPTSRGNLETS